MSEWTLSVYGSGSHSLKHESSGVFVMILPAADDNEGQHLRFDTAKELEDWMNKGPKPWWLELMHRDNERTWRLPTGIKLQVTGPMHCPEQPLKWEERSDSDARIARGLIAESIRWKGGAF